MSFPTNSLTIFLLPKVSIKDDIISLWSVAILLMSCYTTISVCRKPVAHFMEKYEFASENNINKKTL